MGFASSGGGATPDGITLDYTGAKIEIKDDGVTLAKMAAGTAGKLIGFDGAGDPAEITETGAGHVTILPFAYHSVIQGTWAFTNSSTTRVMGYLANTSLAQNDELNFKAALSAGTYTFVLFTAKNSNHGICHVYVAGTDEGQVDLYNGSLVENQISKVTGVTVASGGIKDINLKMETKNGSSTGYYLQLYALAIYKTA